MLKICVNPYLSTCNNNSEFPNVIKGIINRFPKIKYTSSIEHWPGAVLINGPAGF
jgi:hypothetical protein